MSDRPRRRAFRPGDSEDYDRAADQPTSCWGFPLDENRVVENDEDDEGAITEDDDSENEKATDRLLSDRPPHWD